MQKFYKAFEDKFRGSKTDVKRKVSVYLELLKDKDKKIVDLGCGRGEFLELLNENNFKNLHGVDINKEMTKNIKKEIKVHNLDALTFLKNQEDKSFDVITSFHMIEHINFDILFELVKESYRVLSEDGILIFETPNPENIKVACESFYLDPTHKRPIPPTLLQFLLEYFGFHAKILRLNNPPISNKIKDVIEHVSPDYAVVGFKNKDMIDEEFFNRGANLDTVENAFENRIKNIENQIKNLGIEKIIAENFQLKALNKNLENENKELKKHLDMTLNENNRLNTHIKNLETHIQNLENENNHLKHHIQNLENKNTNLNNHLANLRNRFKLIKTELKNYKKENENLKNQIHNLENHINHQTNHIHNLENHIKHLENENRILKNHLSHIENLYNDVINSKSWKITKPLRVVTNLFREKKRETIIQVINKENENSEEYKGLSQRSKEIYEMLKKEIKANNDTN